MYHDIVESSQLEVVFKHKATSLCAYCMSLLT